VHTHGKLEVIYFSIDIKAWYTLLDQILECYLLDFYFFTMSQTLNFVFAFDGMNYGYCKARMHFFLKSIDV
jgi:hypothetical protein